MPAAKAPFSACHRLSLPHGLLQRVRRLEPNPSHEEAPSWGSSYRMEMPTQVPGAPSNEAGAEQPQDWPVLWLCRSFMGHQRWRQHSLGPGAAMAPSAHARLLKAQPSYTVGSPSILARAKSGHCWAQGVSGAMPQRGQGWGAYPLRCWESLAITPYQNCFFSVQHLLLPEPGTIARSIPRRLPGQCCQHGATGQGPAAHGCNVRLRQKKSGLGMVAGQQV